MRRPRVIGSISALGVAALVAVTALSGCGVAADDTAATVGDTVIKASTVNALAADDDFVAAMASQALPEQRGGVVDGTTARQVLSFLVQQAVLAQEVDRWGVTVSASDRSDAAKQISQQAPRIKGEGRELVTDFLADRTALSTALTKLDPTDESDLRKLYDGIPDYWHRVCLTAIGVPAGSAARAVERALDSGTDLAGITKKVKAASEVASKKDCLALSQLPSALRAEIDASSRGETVGPVVGVLSGDAVLFFRVESSERLSFTEARSVLRQLAQSVVQNGIAAWLSVRINDHVTIAPPYGTELTVTQQGLEITPPAVPLGTVDAAAAASGSGSAGSGSAGSGSAGSGSAGTGSAGTGSTGSATP